MSSSAESVEFPEFGVLGVGAWGPGFSDWQQLCQLMALGVDPSEPTNPVQRAIPKPAIIPANERRRAPLPARIAVEASAQALRASQLEATELPCVFGSGLGDTDITDYLCRALNTEAKQLSPTKFHNSVHNAAAGYWTISTGCMKSANAIAAFGDTAGLCLLEALTLCQFNEEPVLLTVYDTRASEVYRDIFPCSEDFAASLVICPRKMHASSQLAVLRPGALGAVTGQHGSGESGLTPQLRTLAATNPAAQLLHLLTAIDYCQTQRRPVAAELSVAPSLGLTITASAVTALSKE